MTDVMNRVMAPSGRSIPVPTPEIYKWVTPGEGVWGEFVFSTGIVVATIDTGVYVQPGNVFSDAPSGIAVELRAWTLAGTTTAARIDEYIDLLEDVEGEEE